VLASVSFVRVDNAGRICTAAAFVTLTCPVAIVVEVSSWVAMSVERGALRAKWVTRSSVDEYAFGAAQVG
jgi:hypothetical protein